MKYDLAAMTQRARKTRRREIVFRPIIPPTTLASNLFATAYAPIVKAWSDAIPSLVAAYEQALSELTTDSPEGVTASVSQVEQSLQSVLLSVRLRLTAWAQMVERWQRGKWRGAVLSATAVDIDTLVGPEEARMTIGAAVERNVALVRSVSDEARSRMSDRVFQGLRERKPAREVAADLREAVAMSRRRSLLIASDQLSKVSAELNDERRREAGLSMWAWVSSHALHYRPIHHARNGHRYDDDATEGVHKPPSDRPGQLIHCKCTSRAVLSLEGEF